MFWDLRVCISHAPQEGRHKACRNNGNFSLDQIFDRHGISQGGTFLRQLLIFSLPDQTGSQQTYQSDLNYCS
uniref:Uncharacterized protein n=1 Tax=Arundo donax TaxID=35708 RepID=A0A0A9ED36_ARUDO